MLTLNITRDDLRDMLAAELRTLLYKAVGYRLRSAASVVCDAAGEKLDRRNVPVDDMRHEAVLAVIRATLYKVEALLKPDNGALVAKIQEAANAGVRVTTTTLDSLADELAGRYAEELAAELAWDGKAAEPVKAVTPTPAPPVPSAPAVKKGKHG